MLLIMLPGVFPFRSTAFRIPRPILLLVRVLIFAYSCNFSSAAFYLDKNASQQRLVAWKYLFRGLHAGKQLLSGRKSLLTVIEIAIRTTAFSNTPQHVRSQQYHKYHTQLAISEHSSTYKKKDSTYRTFSTILVLTYILISLVGKNVVCQFLNFLTEFRQKKRFILVYTSYLYRYRTWNWSARCTFVIITISFGVG